MTKLSNQADAFFDAVNCLSLADMRRIYQESPTVMDELKHVHGEGYLNRRFIEAAEKNRTDVMEFFIGLGANVDGEGYDFFYPLLQAVEKGALEAVKWLIDHGARVNVANVGCPPLVRAAKTGNIEIVKELLSHGADTRGRIGDRVTPLDFAIRNGNTEIADLLRPLTVVEEKPKQKTEEGTRFEPQEQSVLNYFLSNYGQYEKLSLQQIVPTGCHVAICAIPPSDKTPNVVLFTLGLSRVPMNVPRDSGICRRAELFMELPGDWQYKNLDDPQWAWPYGWLLRLAQNPSNEGGWVGGPCTFYSYGEPAQPIVPGRKFTALMLAEHDRVSTPERQTSLLRVIPVFEAERQFEQQNGWKQLFNKLTDKQIPLQVDVNRSSAV